MLPNKFLTITGHAPRQILQLLSIANGVNAMNGVIRLVTT